jgi:acetolactate synthase-1/2/3 large subunit
VLIDIPRDVQESPLEFRYRDTVELSGWAPPLDAEHAAIVQSADAIGAARRPILYVGGGAQNPKARSACVHSLTSRKSQSLRP